MYRKWIAIPILLVALVAPAACGNKKDAAQTAAGSSPTGAIASATADAGACPEKATKKLAKTRFVLHAGLAAGAFKRYIYKPLRAGTFKNGAEGRKKAIVKAALAGGFVLWQTKSAKGFVDADPTLCKSLKAPVNAMTNTFQGLVGKLKSGDVDPSELTAADGALEGLRGSANGIGAGFKDKDVPESALSKITG